MALPLDGSKPRSPFARPFDPGIALVSSGRDPATLPAELDISIGLDGVTIPICGHLRPASRVTSNSESVRRSVLFTILDGSIEVTALDT